MPVFLAPNTMFENKTRMDSKPFEEEAARSMRGVGNCSVESSVRGRGGNSDRLWPTRNGTTKDFGPENDR